MNKFCLLEIFGLFKISSNLLILISIHTFDKNFLILSITELKLFFYHY